MAIEVPAGTLIGAMRDALGIGGAAEAEEAPTTESADPRPRAVEAATAIGRTMRDVVTCMPSSPLDSGAPTEPSGGDAAGA
jgi:hypothetical protein